MRPAVGKSSSARGGVACWKQAADARRGPPPRGAKSCGAIWTPQLINEHMKEVMSEADLLALVSQSSEFENVKVREEELPELDRLLEECVCDVKVRPPCSR